MNTEDMVKAGMPLRLAWGEGVVQLTWEVWGEIRPLRAMFTVELELNDSRHSKVAFDSFDEALDAMEEIKRKHAVAIARKAMRLG